MNRQSKGRAIGAAAIVMAILIGASAAIAAPPVEEELPDGQTGRLRGTVAPQSQPQGRQGVATGAGAAAGALRALVVTKTAPLVVEGEALSVKPSRGQIQIEDMSAFGGGWSGGRQLKWSAPGDGAMLMVSPDVPAGRYDATLHLTQGPVYARIEVIGLEGVIPKSDVELYGSTVFPPAQVSLGVIELGPERGFAIRIVGRDPRATGYAVGLDKLTLVKVEAADPSRHQ
jgi:hypothetical protein